MTSQKLLRRSAALETPVMLVRVGVGLSALLAVGIWAPLRGPETIASASAISVPQGAVPDLEGVFVRADTIGGGSWDGANAAIPRALLLDGPAGGRGGPGAGGRGRGGAPGGGRAAGAPMPLGGAGCGGGGFINLMQHSSAFHIVQQKDEVLLVGEMPMTRRFYMDGRKHPDMSVWEGSGVGHSIGRYEGDTLVVDTVGFAGGGIPGGGRATRETVLTERFRMTPDGKMLHATMTWDDPKIYQKPHVYEFFYNKMPDEAYAFEEWCDMSDPRQGEALGGFPGRGLTPAPIPRPRP